MGISIERDSRLPQDQWIQRRSIPVLHSNGQGESESAERGLQFESGYLQFERVGFDGSGDWQVGQVLKIKLFHI